MAVPADRQQAADANLVAYSPDMKKALTQSDPGALLMMGFFTNNAVGKTGFNGFTMYCSTNCKSGVDYRVKNLQVASCKLGAKGWLFWTWDTNTTTSLANQNLFYSLADSRGAINGQLAPVARPNACS